MKTLIRLGFFGLLFMSLLACKKNGETESECGDSHTFNWNQNFKNASETLNYHMWYELLDNYQTRISFYASITNVCPHQHVYSSATIIVDRDHACLVQARVGLCPGIPNDTINLDKSYYQSIVSYIGSISSGLKQCYGDSAARYWLKVWFTFPGKGSHALDMNYFLDSIHPDINYQSVYSWYKAPS